MTINEIIDVLKKNSSTLYWGKEINEHTTRDQILYGDTNQICTGIVTTCYASVEVIEKAGKAGYNLIIAHEAAFWNHGDHTDWLKDNTAFIKKVELLKKYNICIWRNHDHIHAGIPIDNQYKDGIFYGMCAMMGWIDYQVDKTAHFPQYYEMPTMTVQEMADLLMNKFHLRGVRFIGNPNCKIKKVYVPLHIMGKPSDNDLISKINDENINCLITLEMVDFTVCEYMRDAAMLNEDKCIFALGHFNMEEIGMEFYADYIRTNLLPSLPVCFLQSGDAYAYIKHGASL